MTDTSNSVEYWNHWYQNELNRKATRKDYDCYDQIAMAIKSKNKGKCLDYGTGRAFFLEYIHEYFPSMLLFGSDHSDVAMADAMKRMPFLTWSNDISIYPEGYFDVVACIHTLEHFENAEKVLKQLADLTVKDGFLVIVMPLDDRKYEQHCRIWHIQDMIELFNTLGKEWTYRLIIRQQKKNENDRIFNMVYPDDLTPMMETIAILKRVEV